MHAGSLYSVMQSCMYVMMCVNMLHASAVHPQLCMNFTWQRSLLIFLQQWDCGGAIYLVRSSGSIWLIWEYCSKVWLQMDKKYLRMMSFCQKMLWILYELLLVPNMNWISIEVYEWINVLPCLRNTFDNIRPLPTPSGLSTRYLMQVFCIPRCIQYGYRQKLHYWLLTICCLESICSLGRLYILRYKCATGRDYWCREGGRTCYNRIVPSLAGPDDFRLPSQCHILETKLTWCLSLLHRLCSRQ